MESTKEQTINGIRYQIGRLNAMKQFHMARRIAPILAETIRLAGGITIEEFLNMATVPLAEALANMPDATAEYVIYTAMEAVRRDQNGTWAKVKVDGRNALMFEDIDLSCLLKLTFFVVQENLASFLASDLLNLITGVETKSS